MSLRAKVMLSAVSFDILFLDKNSHTYCCTGKVINPLLSLSMSTYGSLQKKKLLGSNLAMLVK